MEIRAKPETRTPAIQQPRSWLETVIRPAVPLGIWTMYLPNPFWMAMIMKVMLRVLATCERVSAWRRVCLGRGDSTIAMVMV